MSISVELKEAIKTVVNAAVKINSRFPVKWEDIADKPTIPDIDVADLYTKEEVKEAIQASKQLTSPDGSIWEQSIDNKGIVTWKKVNADGR